MLGLVANWLAAALLAFTIFFYVAIYTMRLKRWTPQNIVIGGAAGAFPPMIGWAAATGAIGLESVLMFLIIFFWTPPHFWALSLWRAEDYARAGIPMLPVVAGYPETRRQILIYSVALVPIGAAPWLFGYAGLIYGVAAVVAGAEMVRLAVAIVRLGEADIGHRAAKRLFGFSILYLFSLFAVLLIDNRLGAPGASCCGEPDAGMEDNGQEGHRPHGRAKAPPPRTIDRDRARTRRADAVFCIITIVKLGHGVNWRGL